MKKSILFDLDGTLTDSGEGIINCAIYTLEYYGLPIPTREELRVIVGPPLHESFVKFGVPKEEADNAVNKYRERYVPIGKFENTPYPGIHQLLEKLQKDGHRLFVATSKPEAMSVEILEHFDMAQYFEIISGASLDTSRSSKEAVIAYLLNQCGEQENAVMVGDTHFDVIGAKAHGIPTIGVSWGYGTEKEMMNAGAATIVHTMDELYQELSK